MSIRRFGYGRIGWCLVTPCPTLNQMSLVITSISSRLMSIKRGLPW